MQELLSNDVKPCVSFKRQGVYQSGRPISLKKSIITPTYPEAQRLSRITGCETWACPLNMDLSTWNKEFDPRISSYTCYKPKKRWSGMGHTKRTGYGNSSIEEVDKQNSQLIYFPVHSQALTKRMTTNWHFTAYAKLHAKYHKQPSSSMGCNEKD